MAHKTQYVSVQAEVCLDDFDEEDLVDYLTGRGYFVSKNGDGPIAALSVYEALKTHQSYANELVERFVCEAAGRISL